MRLYGLVGKTLKHSFSKDFFTRKFAAENLSDCRYENFELSSVEELTKLINQPYLKGLNVTIPYKESVIPFLNFQNEVVQAIGACNCIKIENGQLIGYNTDVIGFEQTLKPHLQKQHNKALVLGTGGASKAVKYVLQKLGIDYQTVSRNAGANTIGYDQLNKDILTEHTVIINTTPLGMYPNMDAVPDIPYQYITSKHLLYDLIYNPPQTKFLQQGAVRGATVCNGQDMLVIQAEESWRIWNS